MHEWQPELIGLFLVSAGSYIVMTTSNTVMNQANLFLLGSLPSLNVRVSYVATYTLA